jgi:hypothetical protein
LTPVLAVITLIALGSSAAFVLPALLRLVKGCNIEELSPEWIERFSSRSYYPMDNLLTDEDFSFLSRQPGFDWRLYRKLRRDRLRIYRQYLSRMIEDFNRLHLLARILVSQSETDQSPLIAKLVWIKVRFCAVVVRAQLRYLLCYLGAPALSARALIAELEALSAIVRSVAPAAA